MSRPKLYSLAISIGLIFIIFLLIVIKTLTTFYIPNEVDILPFARQFSDSNWLQNDWYLNLEFTYRNLFNIILGPLVSWLGFDIGKFVGRFLVYLFLAIAIYNFFKTIRLNFVIGLLVVFFFLDHQSIVAAEWIVQGVDTKTVAYSFVIFSWAALIRKRYLLAFACIGASTSFHPLVGVYAIYCSVLAILANKEWRDDWHILIKQSWPFFITGIFGIWTIIESQLQSSDVDSNRTWWIYTVYRHPHHLLPSSWHDEYWIIKLSLAIFLFGAVFTIGKSRALRFLAAYALASVSLFLIGLGIYALGEINLLRFYWFRFPDVIVPFMSLILFGIICKDFLKVLENKFFSLPRIRTYSGKDLEKRIRSIATFVAILVIFATASKSTFYRIKSEINDRSSTRDMELWIAKYTPKDSVFLINPKIDTFYVFAQRSVFVTFKHVPQSAPDIIEWYERIKLCNGGRPPVKTGVDSLDEIQSNFYNLDEGSIRKIAKSYGVDYYLGLLNQNLTFDLVHFDGDYALYKIDLPPGN